MARHERRYAVLTLEHFIVWMRMSAMPDFRKHWGRVQQDLEPGEYEVVIQNSYDVSRYSGKKYVVLSTTNAFGGKHYLLGGLLVGIGGLAVVLCVVFLIGYKAKEEKDKIPISTVNPD